MALAWPPGGPPTSRPNDLCLNVVFDLFVSDSVLTTGFMQSAVCNMARNLYKIFDRVT